MRFLLVQPLMIHIFEVIVNRTIITPIFIFKMNNNIVSFFTANNRKQSARRGSQDLKNSTTINNTIPTGKQAQLKKSFAPTYLQNYFSFVKILHR